MKLLTLALSGILLSACGGYFIPDKNQMYNKSMAKTKNTAQVDFTQSGYLRSYMTVCLPYKGKFKYLHSKVLVSKGEGSKYSVEKVTALLPANENILIGTLGSTTSGGRTSTCNKSQVVRLKKGKKYSSHLMNLGSRCGLLFAEKNKRGKDAMVNTANNYVPCQDIPKDMKSYKFLNYRLGACDKVTYLSKDSRGEYIKHKDREAACKKIMNQKTISDIDKIVKNLMN